MVYFIIKSMDTFHFRINIFIDVLVLFLVLSSDSDLYNGLYFIIGVVMTTVVCLSCNILLILIIMIVCVKNYKKNKLIAELRSQ